MPGRTISPPTSAKRTTPAELASEREYRQLVLDAVVLVGAREVRHQPDHGDRFAVREALDQRSHIAGAKAKPVHAGIDLDEHLERPRKLRGLQHAHLVFVVHDGRQSACGQLRQLPRIEKSLEQEDATRVVHSAQANRRVEFEQCQAIGIVERRQNPLQAVTVRIRLDDGEHLRPRRARAHHRDVGLQCGQVDLCKDRSGHDARVGMARSRRER
jgi:hypothetical protein